MSRVTSTAAGDGRARRWDTHRAARHRDLTRAARRAIHRGGPELSMDEIAAAMGTSKSIVYRYFRDRTGLRTAVGEMVLHDLGAALAQASRGPEASGAGPDPDPERAVRAMVTVYLKMVSTSPSVYAFVTRGGDAVDGTAPMRTLAHDAAALLQPVLSEVVARQDRPVRYAGVWAAGIIGFVRGAADSWLTDPAPEPLPALAAALTDWICRGTVAAAAAGAAESIAPAAPSLALLADPAPDQPATTPDQRATTP